jgi:acid phosphatase family membrane protein YuiD
MIPPFLIPPIVGILAQLLKALLNHEWYATLPDSGQKIPRYGGMPSAHTAFAFSIATVVAARAGFHSAEFVIATALVILILDDALRMRVFLSRHGQALHKLVQTLPPDAQKNYPYLESRLGHTITEVAAGAALGITLSLIILWFV